MQIRVGMAGLGGGARHVLPLFSRVPEVELAAVADIRPQALAEFRARGIRCFNSAEEMCEDPDLDAIWVATPNELHRDHVVRAASNGKHVIGQKPMALTIEEAQEMVDAVERNGVKYVQGHSKIFDPPVRKMREVVASGRLGRLIQLCNLDCRNWLNQPRLASELDARTGGGVVYRQGPHQTDVIRGIGGGLVKSVRAITGHWSPYFPDTEGNFVAFLEFEDGTAAALVMSGYGHFNVSELTWGIGEGGSVTPDERLRAPKERLTQAFGWEEKYALPEYTEPLEELERREGPSEHQRFYGLTVATCERGDIRQSPDGVYVYTDDGREEIPCDGQRGAAELSELRDAIAQNRQPFPDARWAMATLEVVLAMRQSSAEGREIRVSRQVPYPD